MFRKRLILLSMALIIIISILAIAQTENVTNLKNVTFAQNYIKWTWKDPTDSNFSKVMVHINGEFKKNITKGKQTYNATGLEPNTEYEIGIRAVDKKENISLDWVNNSAITAPEIPINDTTPPASITNLKNVTYKPKFIRWTWKDPTDEDLVDVIVYINGEFKDNVTAGIEFINATGLRPNTTNTISTRTVDKSGNINLTWRNHSAQTSLEEVINDTVPPQSITELKNTTYKPTFIVWAWKDPSDSDLANITVFIDGKFKANITKGKQFYNLTGLSSKTEYTISTRTVDKSGNINSTWRNLTTITSVDGPKIKIINQPKSLNVTVGTPLSFNISVNQDNTRIIWKIGNDNVKTETISKDENSNFTFNRNVKGIYNLKVIAENDNGTDNKIWSIALLSKTFLSGNRIWDGSKPTDYALTYTWNPLSFSGFYYNIDDDVGSENISITLDSYTDRTINKGDIIYSTSPEEVNFEFSDFGKYQVIGFMADKYFAGYTDNSTPPKPKETVRKLSVISQGQLHKILLDDDEKRVLTVGSTITLKEGYVIKAEDVGDRTMLISLIKDGNVVDPASLLNAGETYVYKKRVGYVQDLPIIMVKFETVFMGQESQMAILRGIFQISENYINVKNGDKYGVMEITEASQNKIAMENDNSVDLSSGSVEDLMGNLKIIVANNDTALRFALFSERIDTFDVRGTIFPATDEWTPLNFGQNIGKTNIGFYYDIDEDIGNERLKINKIGSSSIKEGDLIYSTSPQEVNFDFPDFGKYQVIGFMADKYFAGYTDNSIISNNKKISTIGSGQLHKVLLDDEEKRVITVGGTLTLKEGYVLKAKEIDVGVGNGQIWMTLLKDGNEIDDEVVSSKDNYIYIKNKVGSVSDLPTIAVHIDSIFRGREASAAFIKGVFQISDAYNQVKNGDDFGSMEVTKTGTDEIVMENKNSIDLSSGSTTDLMGNIKFKVADSESLRFYPFVTVTSGMVANQLIIDAPSKANAGDDINIKITAGGDLIEGASISIDPDGLIDNNTDSNGTLSYTLPKTLKGMYNITASKLGYEKATKSIDIQPFIVDRLSIDIPVVANQFEIMTISISHNNTPIEGVNISFDNQTIGVTDSSGKLNYTPEISGTHTITASKSGYVSTSVDIDVKVPFSEFKALDIIVAPNSTYKGDNVLIRSNVTNAGTKNDSLPVALIINDTEVDNKTISLNPKEVKEIDFNYNVKLGKGNYTVQILEQNQLLEIKEKPFNIYAILAAIIVIGGIIIYLFTSQKGIGINLNKLDLLPIFRKFRNNRK